MHEDFEATVEHYRRLYGGMVVMERLQPTWHACLMDVGRVLFEIFVPNEFFLHTRYGPHYLGVEYQVDDMVEVRAVLAFRGIRVARDLDVALHAHPADCHGVSLEFFDGYFHDNDDVLDTPMRPAEYWRDEHPLGLTGLWGYTVAVRDLEQALEDFRAVLHGGVVHEAPVAPCPAPRSGSRSPTPCSSSSPPTVTDHCANTCSSTARESVRRSSKCSTWITHVATSRTAGSSWCPAPRPTPGRYPPCRTGA